MVAPQEQKVRLPQSGRPAAWKRSPNINHWTVAGKQVAEAAGYFYTSFAGVEN